MLRSEFMSKAPRRLLPPTAGRTPIQKHAIQQFGRRLHELIVERNMSQSDLARKAFGVETSKDGYPGAKGRDRISAYIAGRTYPEPRTLKRIADALGMTVEELAPDVTAAAVDRENPEISINMIAGHADKVHLVVNKLLPLSIAMEIGSILAKLEKGKP
jgi:transcriptional regulator with XRE-family HTH domain